MSGKTSFASVLIAAASYTGTGLAQAAPSASKLTTLYTFTGLAPTGEMAHDATGALYGAAADGEDGRGAVFQLTPPTASGSGWTASTIYSFGPAPDGYDP